MTTHRTRTSWDEGPRLAAWLMAEQIGFRCLPDIESADWVFEIYAKTNAESDKLGVPEGTMEPWLRPKF